MPHGVPLRGWQPEQLAPQALVQRVPRASEDVARQLLLLLLPAHSARLGQSRPRILTPAIYDVKRSQLLVACSTALSHRRAAS